MFNYVHVSNTVFFRNYGIKDVHISYAFPISYLIKIVFDIKI